MFVTDYAIRFRTAVFVLLAAFTVLGTAVYLTMPREGFPDITIPYVFVSAPYEGAAPSETENLITIPMERQLRDLENVKEIRSVSSEGMSFISIEFTPKEDIRGALQRVKDKIDMARRDLPGDLDEPIVEVVNFNTDIPIITTAFFGDAPPEQLKLLADNFADAVEDIPGVKQASVYGTLEREIRIEVDGARLASFGLPIGAVMGAVARENRTVSVGNIEMAAGKVQIRVPGEFKLAGEVKRIPVGRAGDKTVHMGDVAAVYDTHKDPGSITRINGKPCVSVQIKKRSGVNTVDIANAVKKTMAGVAMPEGVRAIVTNDQSTFISSMVRELEDNILSGLLLVIGVLFVFLGWRNSLFVALAIPTTFTISLVLMGLSGFTLNMMVLFSLVMSAGMVVDDVIVIVENSFRLRSEGFSSLEAARRGAAEVAWPVTTSTLTTLLAFLPLLFWPGIMGQFMGFLPKTVIVVLLSSLFVALASSPPVCSVFIAASRASRQAADAGKGQAHPFLDRYESFLRAAVAHRGLVMLLGFALLAFTGLLYAALGRGVELFPETQPRSATIDVKFPQGTRMERTDSALREIESLLPRFEDVKFYLSTAGAAGGFSFANSGGTPHAGNIYVEFLPSGERKGDTRRLVERIRAAVPGIAGAEIKVSKEEEGPPTGAPVSIEVSGGDFETLSRIAREIERAIETVPGIVGLRDDFEEARPELQLKVDRGRAAMMGLDTGAVGDFMRTAVFGSESGKFRAGEDEYDITVRMPASTRQTASLFDEAIIPTGAGASVPVSSLGNVVFTGGKGDITRKNHKRVVTVSGDIQGRSIDAVLGDVRKRVANVPMPDGYSVSYTGQNQEMKESGAFLAQALGVAVALIAVVLVIEFNSVVLPGIILVSVVLSMIGVMWGLVLCGMRFGVIMTGLGVISLAGVVVKNSIVLIDCTIQLRKEGHGAVDAVVLAGRRRLRPVLLTAACTVLGLVPMAVGWSVNVREWPWRFVAGAESSDWWAPMAVALIFGLCVATALTLVQVPVMYSLAESLVEGLRAKWRRRRPD